MAKVVLEGVYKIYPALKGRGERVIIDDLSLTIQDREFMVLVGPSGCGKSTTLRMIAGLEEVSRGAIFLNGRRINDLPAWERDFGMVFQNYALYPHMSARRNMAFPLELRDRPRAEIDRKVGEVSSLLGLSQEMLERKPRLLSGGQRQRVALGRAIMRQPQAFLFDEPLSNLDAKMRVQMRAEISKLHTRLATTMIYVTHDQVEAMTMGDRIVVMKDGRIQQIAPPLEIYHSPANVFVGSFIGSPPMNYIEGTIIESKGRLFFGEIPLHEERVPTRLALTDEQSRKLAPFLGRPVIFGIRPEDLQDRLYVSEPDPDHVFAATIEVVEPIGSETYLYLSTGSHPLIVRSHSRVCEEVSARIEIVAHMKKAHFFESADRKFFQNSWGQTDVESWQAGCARII